MSRIQKQATRPVAATRVPPRSPGRLRWGIGMWLGVGVLVNYFDRVNLSTHREAARALMRKGGTIMAGIDEAVPLLSAALYARFSSRGEADFADRVVSAMRFQFGGHVEQRAGAPGS